MGQFIEWYDLCFTVEKHLKITIPEKLCVAANDCPKRMNLFQWLFQNSPKCSYSVFAHLPMVPGGNWELIKEDYYLR